MAELARVACNKGDRVERVLGRIRGAADGPTLICVGGIHGNEPAGVAALARVVEALHGRNGALSGEFVALTGNREALFHGRRFMGRDLNRAWTAERVSSLLSNGGPLGPCPEDREQIELMAAMDQAFGDARGAVFVLDLHTTSGAGGVFSTVGDTLPNRAFAMHFQVPLVLGLEELVDGTMLEHLDRRGCTAALFEGGQHQEPEAVDRSEAAVWVALVAAGLVRDGELPEAERGRELLTNVAKDLPRVLEIRYRYGIDPEGDFSMMPGYDNFQPVEAGEVLAKNGDRDVRSPETARVLMPLYQEQGEDGFFLVRSFHPVWLRISAVLRRVGVDRIIHWLPGVRRHPTRPGAVIANKHVARWYALEIMHLLGYRKKTEEEGRLVVDRRGQAPGSR